MKRILTSLAILLTSISYGYGQCSVDLKTSSNTAYCYDESPINLTSQLIVSNNNMALSSLYSGLLTKSNNTWWLNTKVLKGKSYDSLDIKVYKEYKNTGDSCYDKDSIILRVHFVDLRFKQPNPYCYDDGRINISADWSPYCPEMIFSSNMKGLVEKVGNTWWFNTIVLQNAKQTIKVYKSCKTKLGCYSRDSFYLTINANPLVKVKDKAFCQDIGDIELSGKKVDIVVLPTQGNIKGGFRTWSALSHAGSPPPLVLRNDGTSFDAKWKFVSIYPDLSRLGKYELEFKFENSTTGCIGCDTMILEIKEVPVVRFTPIPEQCNYWDTLDLNNSVNLKNGEWIVLEKNNQREWSPGDYSTYVIDKHKFDPSIAGTDAFTTFYLRFNHTASVCPTSDSIQMVVHGRPNLEDNILLDTQCNTTDTVCFNAKVYGQFNNTVRWEGEHLKGYGYYYAKKCFGMLFFPSELKSDTASVFTKFKLKYSYQDPFTTCESFDSTEIVVQDQARIQITLDTLRTPQDLSVPLKAVSPNNNGIRWSTNGDGSFKDKENLNTDYTQGTMDKSIGSTMLFLETTNNGPCKAAKDSLILEIFPLNIKDNNFNALNIYPSPTASNLSIELPSDFTSGALRILRIDGKLAKEYDVQKNNGIFTEDISSIPTGIYFVELVSKEGIYKGKIMKK